ncbi:hypothetical protein SANTM175S_10031 [Streptomyces antimycoticus]
MGVANADGSDGAPSRAASRRSTELKGRAPGGSRSVPRASASQAGKSGERPASCSRRRPISRLVATSSDSGTAPSRARCAASAKAKGRCSGGSGSGPAEAGGATGRIRPPRNTSARRPVSVRPSTAFCTIRITGTGSGATAARWAASRYASGDAASRKRWTRLSSSAGAGVAAVPGTAVAGAGRGPPRPGSSSGRTAVPLAEAISRAQSASGPASGSSTGTGTPSKRARAAGSTGSATVQSVLAEPGLWVRTCQRRARIPEPSHSRGGSACTTAVGPTPAQRASTWPIRPSRHAPPTPSLTTSTSVCPDGSESAVVGSLGASGA